MNFINLDFLVYSSHKTSTQSIITTININNLKSIHFHILSNCQNEHYENIKNNQSINHETFIQGLIDYKNTNNKKLRIISIIRNPKDRLISSFFQSFHTDEINYCGKNENNTTINLKNEEEICVFYEELLKKNKLPGFIESIDEMSDIFKINIIDHLIKKKNYYYLNHELFELYVLDFNKIIGLNRLNYLNDILKTNFTIYADINLSNEKQYFSKYKNVKKMLGTKLDNLIENKFKSFYFNLFKKDKLQNKILMRISNISKYKL
jgi:hypothetical protein